MTSYFLTVNGVTYIEFESFFTVQMKLITFFCNNNSYQVLSNIDNRLITASMCCINSNSTAETMATRINRHSLFTVI